MSPPNRRPNATLPLITLATIILAAAGCFIVQRIAVNPVAVSSTDSVRVKSAVKAHLLDGTTVTYPNGVELVHGMLRGAGRRYDLALRELPSVSVIPLDSVLGMESYSTVIDGGATAGYSILATAGVIVVAAGVAIAAIAIQCAHDPKCFGSCPTFYSDSAGTFRLEAEGFSYSIASLFEARDVDRLRTTARPDGSVRLEVRNEAYETHYLNHLELLEVRHAADEFVLPDARGRSVAVRNLRPATRGVDRAGHDVADLLATADGRVTRTDSALLARADASDFEDHIDMTFPVPRGVDSVALVLRLRNSLLNTVLLYDIVLGDRGARSLDWLGQTTQQVGPALALGQWYAGKMGLRVLVLEGDSAREIAHIRDTGPVAWKDIAVVLPAPHQDSLRLRLSYVADNWRIDRAALGSARIPAVRAWPLAEVIGADDRTDTTALRSLSAPDAQYLVTSPAQRFTAVWRPTPTKSGEARTFLLASQGYYTEWIRQGWLAAPRDTLPFRPSNAVLANAVQRWRVEQDSLEVKFNRTRVPVR
jgi:hypothetical protein